MNATPVASCGLCHHPPSHSPVGLLMTSATGIQIRLSNLLPCLLQGMGLKIDRAQVRKFVDDVDADCSGEIEFGEFLAIMHKELYALNHKESVWKDDIYTDVERKASGFPPSHKGRDSAPNPKAKSTEKNMMPLNLLASAHRRKKVGSAATFSSDAVRGFDPGFVFIPAASRCCHDGHGWDAKPLDIISDSPRCQLRAG